MENTTFQNCDHGSLRNLTQTITILVTRLSFIKRSLIILLTLLTLLSISFTSMASTLPPMYLTGPASRSVGAQATYIYDNGTVIQDFTWHVPSFALKVSETHSGTAHTLVLQFIAPGTGTLQAARDWDILLPYGTKTISATGGGSVPPPDPATTYTTTQHCNGTATVTRNSGPASWYTYYWQTSPSGVSTANSGSSFTVSSTTNVYLRSRSNYSSTWSPGALSIGTVTPHETANGGTIAGNQTTCVGSSISPISSGLPGTGGAGPSYSWQRSTNNTSWTTVSGSGASLPAPPLVAGALHNYFRRVTTTSCGTAVSNTVTITVYPAMNPGSITGTQTICYNQEATGIESTTMGSGGFGTTTYHWESNPGDGWHYLGGFEDPDGLPAMNHTSTMSYRRVMTNSCGTKKSNFITVTVRPALSPGTAGTNQNICAQSAPAALTNTASASGGNSSYAYQWMSSTNGVNFSPVSGATGSSYTPPVLNTPGTYYYKRSVSSCEQTLSTPAVSITVIPLPNPGAISGNQTICAGSTPSVISSVTHGSGGGSFLYHWESSSDNVNFSTFLITSSKFYQPGAINERTYFRRSMETTCGVASSNSVLVDVYSPLQAGVINGTATICHNAATVLGSSSAASGNTGSFTYQWEKSENGAAWTAIASANALTYTTPALVTTTTFRRKVSTTCVSAYSNTVLITVRPGLTAGTIGSPQTLCSGEPAVLNNTTSPAGGTGSYTYQWKSSSDGVNFTPIAGATGSSYAPPALTSSTYYRRSVTSCGQTLSSPSVLITIKPRPVAPTYSAGIVCGSGNTTIAASSVPEGYVVRWYIHETSGLPKYEGADFGTPVISETTSWYMATYNTANGCESFPRTVATVNVWPVPAAPVATGAVRCDEGSVTLTATPGTDANQIRWFSSPVEGVEVNDQLSFTTPTITADTYYYAASYNSVSGCSSPARAPALVRIDPKPVPVLFQTNTVYGSGTVDLTMAYPGRVKFDEYITPTDTSDYQVRWFASETSAQNNSPVLAKGISYTTAPLAQNTTYFGRLVDKATGCLSDPVPVTATLTPFIASQSIRSEVVRTAGMKNEADLETLTDDQRSTAITYMDGAGRVHQQVVKKGSPQGKDIIQPVDFDQWGRASKTYLPYAGNTSDGSFHSAYKIEQLSFYAADNDKVANDSHPFAVTVYEDSPLGRVTEQGAAGAAYQPGTGHTNRFVYGVNTGATSSQAEEVRRFNPDGSSTGFYQANTLSSVESMDADNNKVITFYNPEGKVIMKKQQLDEIIDGATVNYLQTYYIYDDFGRLSFILTPKGTAALRSGGWSFTTGIRDNYCHAFYYDKRGRTIAKKVPGQAMTYFIYDDLDRLVLSQDGQLRTNNRWMFYKYDRKGRLIMTGIYADATRTTRSTMQTYVDGLYLSGNAAFPEASAWEQRGTVLHGYTNNSFPKTHQSGIALEVHTVNYFNDYDFDYNGTADYGYTPQGLTGENTHTTDVYGMATGSKRLVLGTTDWLKTYIFYDEYGRPIQTRSNNHLNLSSMDDLSTTVYSFDGRIMTTKTYHNAGPGRETTVLNTYEYDTQGRLVKVNQGNNGAAMQTLAKYTYNALGQLIDKKLHHTGGENYLQSVDMRYSIRGQLEAINNSALTQADSDAQPDYFGMEMLYGQADAGIGNTAQYNGNISAVKWKGPGSGAGSEDQRSYRYTYDKSNKLKTASFAMHSGSAWNRESGVFNEAMTYDHNGNIETLQRNHRQHGFADNLPVYSSQQMDDLTYTYQAGDRLQKVEDSSGQTAGFNNGSTATEEYAYDDNGNVQMDKNKGIDSIRYNLLGKPEVIWMSGNRRIEYTYDAGGNKLAMKNYEGSTLLSSTDYVANFVYENGALAFFGSPEGRVVKNGNNLEYQYAIADHQGNTRVVFSSVMPGPDDLTATFEGDSNDNSPEYENVDNIVSFLSANHTPSGAKVVRMNQSYNVGPAKSIAVYPGDQVDMEVWAYYEGSSGWGNTSTGMAAFVTNVATAFGGMSGGAGESGVIYDAIDNVYGVVGMAGSQGDSQPSAYLNYILFDKDYHLLDMGWEAVPASANMAQQKISIDNISIKEAGYIFVYLSYEAESNNWVYFDDFKVTHTKTNIIQYNEYYPFGLSASTSWTRENSKNDFLYNEGSELNNTSGWYDLPFRNYDPVLGRFMQVDPLAVLDNSTSPFAYAANNPVYFNDPMGLQVSAAGLSDGQLRALYRANIWRGYTSFGDWAEDNVESFGAGGRVFEGGDGRSYGFNEAGEFGRWGLFEYRYYYEDGVEAEYKRHTEREWVPLAQQGGPGDPNCPTCPNSQQGNDFPWLNVAAANLSIWGGATDIAVNGPKPVNLGKVGWARQVKAGTQFGKVLGTAGLLMTGADMITNGVNTSNSLDAFFGGISFAGPWGAAAGGVYFGANLITTGITGKTIGQHVDDNFIIVPSGMPMSPFLFIPKRD